MPKAFFYAPSLARLAGSIALLAIAAACGSGNSASDAHSSDGGVDSGAGGSEAAATVPSCAKGGAATWSDLYRDCFGPGRANCGASGCHDRSTAAGGGVWVCAATKDSCYAGIQAIVESNTAPENTTLYGALRKDPSCAQCMPRASAFTFDSDDLARVRAWIANGAKSD